MFLNLMSGKQKGSGGGELGENEKQTKQKQKGEKIMCWRIEPRFWWWLCDRYRRAKKKEKEKQAAKELEELAITDPQALVDKMEEADRKRIEVGGVACSLAGWLGQPFCWEWLVIIPCQICTTESAYV